MPKNPAAVSLGRLGGQSKSERKRQAGKLNALKASQAAKAKRLAIKTYAADFNGERVRVTIPED